MALFVESTEQLDEPISVVRHFQRFCDLVSSGRCPERNQGQPATPSAPDHRESHQCDRKTHANHCKILCSLFDKHQQSVLKSKRVTSNSK